MRVLIVGVGMVGGALARALSGERGGDVEVVLHDPAKGHDQRGKELSVDCSFVCVPTPTSERGVELGHVRDALDFCPAGVPTVIRSTVPPGTTETLQAERPGAPLLHAPEFLTEATALHDELHPARKIVGHTRASERHALMVAQLLPSARFELIIDSTTAEMVKYFSNVFYAVKVSFANQMYDMCVRLGLDYRMVRLSAQADPMIAAQHLDVWHKGYRGFAGKCLPKDLRALLALGRELGVEPGLAAEAERYNAALGAASRES